MNNSNIIMHFISDESSTAYSSSRSSSTVTEERCSDATDTVGKLVTMQHCYSLATEKVEQTLSIASLAIIRIEY